MSPEEISKLRSWVKDLAYAEDDFVFSDDPLDNVKELLDALDPDWRKAFDGK